MDLTSFKYEVNFSAVHLDEVDTMQGFKRSGRWIVESSNLETSGGKS